MSAAVTFFMLYVRDFRRKQITEDETIFNDTHFGPNTL